MCSYNFPTSSSNGKPGPSEGRMDLVKITEEGGNYLLKSPMDIENVNMPGANFQTQVLLPPYPINSPKEFGGSSSRWNQAQGHINKSRRQSFHNNDFFLISPSDLQEGKKDSYNSTWSGSFVLHPRPSTSCNDFVQLSKHNKTVTELTRTLDMEMGNSSEGSTIMSHEHMCPTGQYGSDLVVTPKTVTSPLNLDV